MSFQEGQWDESGVGHLLAVEAIVLVGEDRQRHPRRWCSVNDADNGRPKQRLHQQKDWRSNDKIRLCSEIPIT